MKYLMLMVSFVFLISVSLCTEAKNNGEKGKRINVKCYVELIGGQQTIYLAKLKEKPLKSIAKELSNRKIPVVGSNDKQYVHKVFECANLTDKFKSRKGNRLFSDMAL